MQNFLRLAFLSLVLVLFVLGIAGSSAIASLVLNNLSDYTSNFDHLAVANKYNDWTNDQSNESPSGSPGWYWQNGASSLTYEAGSAGSPGPFSMGDSANPADRAMGSYAGSGNLNIAWGIVFQNNTGQTISQVDISYGGEQWRRAETTADSLQFSFVSSASAIDDFLPASGPTPAGWTTEANLAFAAPLAPGTPPYFAPLTPTPIFGTLAVNVPNGHYLALRWHDGDVAGNDAALGIDDLTVSFTATAVPEPSAFLFGGLVCSVLCLVTRTRKRRVASRCS